MFGTLDPVSPLGVRSAGCRRFGTLNAPTQLLYTTYTKRTMYICSQLTKLVKLNVVPIVRKIIIIFFCKDFLCQPT